MDQDNSVIYEKTLKQFILGILYFIVASVFLSIYSYYPLSYPFNYLFFLEAAIHILAIVVVYFVPIVYIKKLITPYFIILIGLMFPCITLNLSIGIITLLFWHMSLPVGIYVVYPNKKAVKWVAYFLLMMVSAYVASQILWHYYEPVLRSFFPPATLHVHLMLIDNVVSAFIAFLMVCYCMYYVHRFHQIQISQLVDAIGLDNDEKDKNLLGKNEEAEKYRQIYARIIEYFTSKQPYLREDFSLTQMAHDLNINPAYLSRAIHNKENMSFNSLVNFYRIEKVKELMQQKGSPKYRLKYIYLSSGFNSQSSFNKAFKMQEGVTPSEYLKQYQENSGES
ncbi:hypothetical protein FACS189426_04470 [Bacteroidia bacterium]|nr:hypothetical protein FACS189426_04470 [Bacteroidia bacterium]